MNNARTALLAGTAFLCAALAFADPPAERTILDFEPGKLPGTWEISGTLTATPVTVPVGATSYGTGPAGGGLAIVAAAGSSIATQGVELPKEWRTFRALSFWVFRAAEEAQRRPGCRIEVVALEADGRARFRRPVEISHEGWTKITLPLRWFRWDDSRVPRWDRVTRLGFGFPDGAEIILDTVAVTPGDAERAAELGRADWLDVGFPDLAAASVKVAEKPDVVVLSDAPALDAEKLAAHLAAVEEAVFAAFPFFEKPFAPAAVMIFATKEEYQAFPPRFAHRLHAVSGAPQADGFTLQGIATTCWSEEFGQARPVFTHEFVHALLSMTARLPNHGDWVQEGLATYFQLRFHPQANAGKVVLAGLADEKLQLPLKTLCNGEHIPVNRYWQAFTLWDTLLASEKHRAKLPALFRSFQESGETNLAPFVGPLLESTWEGLIEEWKTHCREAYAEKEKKD